MNKEKALRCISIDIDFIEAISKNVGDECRKLTENMHFLRKGVKEGIKKDELISYFEMIDYSLTSLKNIRRNMTEIMKLCKKFGIIEK